MVNYENKTESDIKHKELAVRYWQMPGSLTNAIYSFGPNHLSIPTIIFKYNSQMEP